MLSRRSTPAPFRRSKRAAAAAAESKIKKFIQDIDRDDDQVTKGKASPRMIQLMANNISFAPDNLNHEDHKIEKSDRAFEVSEAMVEASSIASSDSIPTILATCSSFSFLPTTLPSAVMEQLQHQRKRASVEVNSTGPMKLSKNSRIRIKCAATPEYSPIVATSLSFTPVAHIPTTPVIKTASM